MDLEKYVSQFPEELQEKARACKTVQELLDLATENDLALPAEALTAVAGGCGHKHDWRNLDRKQKWKDGHTNPCYVWEKDKCYCGEIRYTLEVNIPPKPHYYLNITQEQFESNYMPE